MTQNRIDEMVDMYIAEGGEAEVQQIIRKIAKMTDRNDHSGAAVTGAELINRLSGGQLKAELSDLIDIQKQHDTLGHMPYELGQKRYKILQKVWKLAPNFMDKKLADKFHGAY